MRFLVPSLLFLLLSIPLESYENSGFTPPPEESILDTILNFVPDKLARIIGGNNSPLGKWPWQVKLILADTSGTLFLCGGSIIANRWILTATHCFIPSKEVHTIMYGSAISSRKQYAKQCILHYDYDKDIHNDIALIELYEPINFDENVSPISLPSINTSIRYDAQVIATGFGKSNVRDSSKYLELDPGELKETVFPLVPLDICRKRLHDNNIRETQLCGGSFGHGTAPGDSGGPVVIYSKSGKWFQIGITSYGVYVDNKTEVIQQDLYPGVYTNVQKYCDWIEQNTRGEAKCQKGELIDATRAPTTSSSRFGSIYLAIIVLIALIIS